MSPHNLVDDVQAETDRPCSAGAGELLEGLAQGLVSLHGDYRAPVMNGEPRQLALPSDAECHGMIAIAMLQCIAHQVTNRLAQPATIQQASGWYRLDAHAFAGRIELGDDRFAKLVQEDVFELESEPVAT